MIFNMLIAVLFVVEKVATMLVSQLKHISSFLATLNIDSAADTSKKTPSTP